MRIQIFTRISTFIVSFLPKGSDDNVVLLSLKKKEHLKWNIYSGHGLELSTRGVQVSWHVECQKCFRWDGQVSGAFTEMQVRPIKKEKEKRNQRTNSEVKELFPFSSPQKIHNEKRRWACGDKGTPCDAVSVPTCGVSNAKKCRRSFCINFISKGPVCGYKQVAPIKIAPPPYQQKPRWLFRFFYSTFPVASAVKYNRYNISRCRSGSSFYEVHLLQNATVDDDT